MLCAGRKAGRRSGRLGGGASECAVSAAQAGLAAAARVAATESADKCSSIHGRHFTSIREKREPGFGEEKGRSDMTGPPCDK